jgi:hypothetical protein
MLTELGGLCWNFLSKIKLSYQRRDEDEEQT